MGRKLTYMGHIFKLDSQMQRNGLKMKKVVNPVKFVL